MATLRDVCEIVIQGTVPTVGSGTKNVYNIFHYQSRAHPATDSAIQVANQFVTAVWSSIAAQLSVLYTGVTTLARLMDVSTNQYGLGVAPANGSIAGARLPLDNAVVCLLRTQERGKSFRGSKHFGAIAESQQLNDELTAAAVTAWSSAIQTLVQGVSVPGGQVWDPVILSRHLSSYGVGANPVILIGSIIQSALLNKTLGTMRRRKERTVR